MSSPARFDAVVAGGGHNGLVAAAYLARAGRSVLVLERRDEPGGAAVSQRAFAGREARLSRYAYLVSLFHPQIARELGVELDLRTRPVAAYADGLLVDDPPTSERTAASFQAITGSLRDRDAWLRFAAEVDAVAGPLFASLLDPLPSRGEARALLGDLWTALAERPLGEALAERFEHPLVRGVVATDGLIGTFASLADPGLAQNRCFLWHVIGGRWRVPVGGMGRIAAALASTAREAGAEIRVGAEVLAIDGGDVTFRDRAGEHVVTGAHVLANVAPAELARLRGLPAPDVAEGCQTKVNLLLDRLPALRSGVAAQDAFAGTFRLHEREDELEAAYRQAAAGELPSRPPAELYCHSLTDPSILGADAGTGTQTLTLFGLHTPAALFRGDNAGAKRVLLDRYLAALDEQLAEPIRDCVATDATGAPCVEVKSPLDLEAELRLPAGNIFHGELAWPWGDEEGETTSGAPLARAGTRGVATDDPRIVVCGSSAVRGGGVSGIAGRDAALHVLGR